jgi:hypothetical protein
MFFEFSFSIDGATEKVYKFVFISLIRFIIVDYLSKYYEMV